MAKRKLIPQEEFMKQFSKEAIAEDMLCNISSNAFKEVAQMNLNFLEGNSSENEVEEETKENTEK